jgi:hypothetical protein
MIDGLNKLVEYNKKNIPYLSDGGCGRFGLYLYKHLFQLGVDVKIVPVDTYREIKDVRKLLAEFHNFPNFEDGEGFSFLYSRSRAEGELKQILFETSFGHVLLYVKIDGKKYFIDGYNVYEDAPDEWFDHHNWGVVTYQQLAISVAYGWWNKRYDIRNDRKLIEAIKLFVK